MLSKRSAAVVAGAEVEDAARATEAGHV